MLNTVSSTQMKSHINVHQCKTHLASSCVLLCRSLHWIKTQRFVIENNFAQYIEIVFHHHWKPFCSIYLHSPVLHHDWKQFCHILSFLSPINTNKSVSYLFFSFFGGYWICFKGLAVLNCQMWFVQIWEFEKHSSPVTVFPEKCENLILWTTCITRLNISIKCAILRPAAFSLDLVTLLTPRGCQR